MAEFVSREVSRFVSSSRSPTIDQFIETLSTVSDWYTLGIFLGATAMDLKNIELHHSSKGVMRCLVELHEHLRTIGRIPSWGFLSSCLKRMNSIELAKQIDSKLAMTPSSVTTSSAQKESTPIIVTRERNRNVDVPPEITSEFQSLFDRFTMLNLKIKNAFVKSKVDINDVQHVIHRQSGLTPLVGEKITLGDVFRRLEQNCSIFDSHVLIFLVTNFLSRNQILQLEIKDYEKAVDEFKSSAKMRHLVRLIKKGSTQNNSTRNVKLKVKEFWKRFAIKQFEKAMNELLGTLCKFLSQISVDEGSLCIEWIIPDIDTTNMFPRHSLEFTRIIGVLSLHIGDDVLYDNTTEKGSEILDAAMLEAIQLKNTKAIEFFLAMGCNPELATYNGDNAVTTIVNIRESKKSSVDHVCIIGHNEHVKAIVDPSSKPAECSSCNMKDKMNKQLHIQNEQVFLSVEEKVTENELLKNNLFCLKEEMKIKEAEIILLKKDVQMLIKEKQITNNTVKEKEMEGLKNEVKMKKPIEYSNGSTAIIPHQQLGVGAKMRVKIFFRDSSGNRLTHGGSAVRAVLSCNEEECRVTDNKDGTYFVTVIPQQLGQHQLSITIDNQHIQNSPFNLAIVPQRDYTLLKEPVQTITDIFRPYSIAFSKNSDMFVTSYDHCIHVFDKSGNKKTTIGSEGSGELQFHCPFGIDIKGDIVYVAEYNGHRIHMLTTEGKFIRTFGDKGSGIAQFAHPYDVKVSPYGKVYVADRENDRIQVYHFDWTIYHVIDGRVSGFSKPEGIAFDLFGNVHVTGYSTSSITVFTPSGQFIRQYDTAHNSGSQGIAIDSSGYSLVTSYINSALSVFDQRGSIHSIGGFNNPFGVSVADDGGVWVGDTYNNRLVKY